MTDLFGMPDQPRPKSKAHGYAFAPGTGPNDETCGTCKHCWPPAGRNSYHKCKLLGGKITRGLATDIRVRSPACKFWMPLGDGVG